MGVSHRLVNKQELYNMEPSLFMYNNTRSGSVSPVGSEGSDRPYRMASSFQLGDEQPKVFTMKERMLKANSYDNLFGSPTPMERSRPRERRFTRQEREPTDRRSRRMPVNTLTGAVMGVPDQQLVEPAAMTACSMRTKRSPGGNHSQLW